MKALRWRSVSGGLVALVALVVVVFVVLRYARTGIVHGDKFRLYFAVPDATNLLEGSDVWLNGQRVGTVSSIGFAPPTVPAEVRVVVAARVLTSVRENIRLDSRANLQSGGTIIGAPVVYISAGTLTTRAVVSGDTLRGAGKSDFEIAASRVTEAMSEAPGIIADAKIIFANSKTAGARLGGIMTADHGHGSLPSQGRSLMAKFRDGKGPAARIMQDQDLRLRVSRSMAAADSVRALLSSRMDEVGRFRRDSTLLRAVAGLREEIGVVRRMASSPSGTVGRIAADSALRQGLDSVFAELSALMADIKKNPARYAKVF